jgi:hypothetical protein
MTTKEIYSFEKNKVDQMNLNFKLLGEPSHTYKDDTKTIQLWGEFFHEENLQNLTFIDNIEILYQFYFNAAELYFIVVQFGDEIYFFNDLFSNYRVYYLQKNNEIIFSKNRDNLKKYIYTQHKHKEFFKLKNYTIATHSMHPDIKKIQPLGINKYSHTLQFIPLIQKFKNHYKNKTISIKSIQDNLSIRKEKSIILLFSGGLDSLLLILYLQKLKIEFKAVFIEYCPTERDNLYDKYRTKKIAELLKLDLIIFKYHIKDNSDKYSSIARSQNPDDFGFSAFYAVSDWIKQNYGEVLIINGQSSDSLFTWGISGTNISSMIQRYIVSKWYYSAPTVFRIFSSKLLSLIYSIRHRKRIKIPINRNEIIKSLFVPLTYFLNKNANSEINNEIIEMIHKYDCKEYQDFLLLAKLNYLQGPSNTYVVNSNAYYKLKVIMPYLRPDFLYWGYYGQSTFQFITKPRDIILKEVDNELLEIINSKNNFKNTKQHEFVALVNLERQKWYFDDK